VQTLSSKPTSSSLSIPKKPVAFFQNPLERLEISSSENHPLVHAESLTNTTAKESVVKNSSWEKHLPSSWKPKTDSAIKKTESVKIPPQPSIPPSEKRRLPDEVKAIFEKNSKNFSVLAKSDEKNGGEKAEKLPDPTILDEWDKALLFGEYPPEQKSPKRLSFEGHLSTVGSVSVPKKDAFTEVGTVLPTRVMDGEIVSPTPHKETPILHTKPLSKVSIVPQKPKSFSGNSPFGNTSGGKSPLTPLHIPTKPKTPLVTSSPVKNEVSSSTPNIIGDKKDTDSTTPPPTMSETLVGKIIEGQMRGVFENAPPLLQKNLEKTLVHEILTLEGQKNTGESIENEVWKKRLREYLLNLQERAVSAFPDPKMASPTESELVLDYVKRVYPVLLRS
jgi:hypothetical protein